MARTYNANDIEIDQINGCIIASLKNGTEKKIPFYDVVKVKRYDERISVTHKTQRTVVRSNQDHLDIIYSNIKNSKALKDRTN